MELTLIILVCLFVGGLTIYVDRKDKREKKRQERLNRIKFDWALIGDKNNQVPTWRAQAIRVGWKGVRTADLGSSDRVV